MHRAFLRGISFRFVADSICESKAHESGRNKLAGKLESSRAISTFEGVDSFGYGGASISGSLQMQIVNALRQGDRSKASILLSELGNRNCSLGSADFVHILEYCMRSPNPLFVMEIWRNMKENEIEMTTRCYMLIYQTLCKGGYLDEAFNLINFLGENHCSYPILPMYNHFLRGCAQMRSSMHANVCLNLMEHRLVGKNEGTYWELLKLAVWQQNISAVHEIWKEYVKYYSLSIISLRKFIWSFSRLRDLQAAYETLQHMVAVAFKGSNIISRTADGKVSSSRLDIPIPSKSKLSFKGFGLEESEGSIFSLAENCKNLDICSGNVECNTFSRMETGEARSFGMRMVERPKSMLVMKVLRWSFSDVIHACAHTKNCGMAELLILQMQNLGLEPSCHTYDGFIRAVVFGRGFHDAMEVLRFMQQRSLKPYDSTLATLAVGCCKVLELDLAEALLEQISETPYVLPYNAYLAACDTLDEPERAVRMLAKMKQLKLRPDIRTYELLFSLFGNVNAPYEEGNMLSQIDAAKRINAMEMDMVRNGIQHSHLSLKNLLKALGTEGMIREMIQNLQKAESQFCWSGTYLGTSIYNVVLHSLVEAKESHMAIDIFKNMKSCGFLLDATTYNIMIDCCSIIKCFNSARALVSLMICDGFNPQAVTYTALIKILLEYEEFDEALKLLDQLCSEGIVPDVLLFNTILKEASIKGRVDVVELIVEQMHREKVQPDPSTCSYVFSAYVDYGFHSTAMEALQVLSVRMISEEESILLEKRLEYESFILTEDMEAESRMLELFKNSNENLAAALLNLRWCAMVGSSISWVPNQSPWARRLSCGHDMRRMSFSCDS